MLDWLFGRKGHTEQLPTMTPGQRQALQQLLSQMGGMGAEGFGGSMQYLQDLLSGSPEAMAAYEAPFLRQFKEQTLPQLTERMTGQFGAGGGRASGAAQIMGQAGAGLQEQLAALRSQLQGSAAQQLMGTYMQGMGMGLGAQPFGYVHHPQQQGFLGGMAPYLGMGMGGPLGGALGGAASRMFGGGGGFQPRYHGFMPTY